MISASSLLLVSALAFAAVRIDEQTVSAADGVKLYTRAVVPGEGKFPCVFVRTPYPDRTELELPYPFAAATNDVYVKRGYVHVVQHCRGFGRSEGFCTPYVERGDGLAALAWIRKQPWYDGEIFLVGGSYTTTVHLLYLATEPPDVKGADFSIQTDRMFFRDYRNGCNHSCCNVGWIRYMMSREYPDAKGTDGAVRRPYCDIAKRVFGKDIPGYTARLMHTECDEFWTGAQNFDVMEHVKFPVIWREGLYDFYIEGMVSMWERMLPEWKKKSVFELCPMAHGGTPLKDTPIPYGKPSGVMDSISFFDAIRRGENVAGGGTVRYHSLGSGAWRTGVWPRDVKFRELTFPTDERGWTYDPKGPRIPGLAEGKCQRSWEPGSRRDATEFVSGKFDKAARFFGKPRIRVPVKSDCEDTQFFFRLDLVHPDGSAWNLCQTISSLRHAKEDYRPGETVVLDLELPLTAFTVNPGWAVRLDVCSDGGVYVQHANVAKHWALVTDEEVKVAHNAVAAGTVVLQLPLE